MIRMKEERTLFRALMGHLSGQRPKGGSRRRWLDYIERDVRDQGLEKT